MLNLKTILIFTANFLNIVQEKNTKEIYFTNGLSIFLGYICNNVG